MESADCREAGPATFLAAEDNAAASLLGSGGGELDVSTRAAPETEWQSIPLEDASRQQLECCFHLVEGKQSSQQARKSEPSMCGLSNLIGGEGNSETQRSAGYTTGSKKDGTFISMEASHALGGGKEVRLTFHGLDDSRTGSENVVYKKENKLVNDSGALLGYGDEGCLPLLHQVRAIIKSAKLSCSGLLSGDNRTFLFDGWSSLLQRNFSFKSSDVSSTEGESLCRKGNSPTLIRTESTPMPMVSPIPGPGVADALKSGPLQARDPQSRADALPLAHYRPTDGAIWKEGEVKSGQSTASTTGCKSPVNCKKPPKPPRHPGRSASLDSGTLAAQRAARKSRDRASAKRKSRTASAAASTGVTPLVALVLTIGFGVLMVFQGVFVQTNVSYGRNTDAAFVDEASNLRSSLTALSEGTVSYGHSYRMGPLLSASSDVDASKSEAAVGDAVHKAMLDLPWSRSSLASEIRSASG